MEAQTIDPQPYPVLTWFEPERPRRSLFGRRRRSTAGIPRADQVEIVLRQGNNFSVASIGDLHPGARRFLEADRVYVVQMRDQKLICTCKVEPAGFIVTAAFLCAVQDSCDLVSGGRGDIRPWLESYLRETIGERAEPLRNAREEVQVRANIRAYFKLKPPNVAGLRIDLDSIEISSANGRPGGA